MTSISKTAPFLTVIENHKGIIYKVANAYCKLEADRKDLVQEIILQLWKSFDKYNDQFKYSTWIYRISLNVAISFFRKESTRKNISNPLSDQIFNIAHLQENKQKEAGFEMLYQFISTLQDLDKALILLYLEEKSHKEIAEILGISETNVSTKVGRIKSRLKQHFSDRKSVV